MELIFSTGHYSSKVTKSARIMCNSTGNVPRLAFVADVQKNMDSIDIFQVEPYMVDLDKDRPEDQKHEWEYEFTLRNISDQELEFHLVSQPGEFFEVDFPEGKSIDPGKDRTFKVKFDRDIAGQIFKKSLTIEASDPGKTRTTVPFSKVMRWGPAPTSQR